MEMVTNALNWFEIPVLDFDRAQKFYSQIFDYEMPKMEMGPNTMGILLSEPGKGVGGAIIKGEGMVPTTQGPVIYLNGGNDLNVVLNRIEAAGGKVLVPKMQVSPEIGYCAYFLDCEGNRLALHSQN